MQFTIMDMFSRREYFQSKQSDRLRPKTALKLQDLCFDAVINNLKDISLDSTNEESRTNIREYFYMRLPKMLQKDLARRACKIDKLNVENLLNIYDALGPHWIAKDCVDTISNYIGSDWCHEPGNWRWGNASEWCMQVEQCERFFKIISAGNPGSLRYFSICAYAQPVRTSKLPSILARAHLLREVTILCGASDHLLRILGLNCPLIKVLKLQGSDNVTDDGLRNFFLKRPRVRCCRANSSVKNDVSNSIEEIQIFRTSVTAKGCEFACTQMNGAYIIPVLPHNGIYRIPSQQPSLFYNLDYHDTLSQLEQLGLEPSLARQVHMAIDACVSTEGYSEPVLDIYGVSDCKNIYLREKNSMMVTVNFKTKINHITELTLTWNTIARWDWDWGGPPEINRLMEALPCLERLKSRVGGYWNGSPLFPKLEYAEIWVSTNYTLLAFLRCCPALKIFDCRQIGADGMINDDILLECLQNNSSLASSLIEFNVRPTLLTELSILKLVESCPNIKSIGDLENWVVQQENIPFLNESLDAINSQCVLKVCNFPPFNYATYLK